MSAIGKIYGTQDQYNEFRDWLIVNNHYLLVHLYPISGYPANRPRPISNFPYEADVWLYKHCPLKFVTEAIEIQYDGYIE